MDDKGLKKVMAIILDILFVAVIVLAVYLLVINNFISVNENVLYAIIIFLIPAGSYMTYMSFAREIDWSKLPGDEMDDEEADEIENDGPQDEESENI